MIDGIYAVYYTGQVGTGLAVLVLYNGTITGADVVGGTYDGRYEHNPDARAYEGAITLTVPANTPLVTGAHPRGEPYSVNFDVALKEENIGGEHPISVQLPTGKVNANLRRLRKLGE